MGSSYYYIKIILGADGRKPGYTVIFPATQKIIFCSILAFIGVKKSAFSVAVIIFLVSFFLLLLLRDSLCLWCSEVSLSVSREDLFLFILPRIYSAWNWISELEPFNNSGRYSAINSLNVASSIFFPVSPEENPIRYMLDHLTVLSMSLNFTRIFYICVSC